MVVMDKKTILVTGILFVSVCQVFIPSIAIATADEPLPSLTIIAPTEVNQCYNWFEVIIRLDLNGIENVSVTFNNVTEKTDANGSVHFYLPLVEKNTNFTIAASLEGYENATKTISVLPSKLKITITPGYQQNDTFYEPITVTISDQCGALISGAEIILSGEGTKQNATTVNGQATFFMEKSGTHTYTITASLPGGKDAEANPVTIKIFGFAHDDELFCNLAVLIIIVFIIILVLIVLYYKRKKR